MRIAAAMALVLLLAGCSLFKRPDNQFFSLQTVPGTPVAASGAPLGIDTIELPPTLARRGIVVRDDSGKLEVRGTHQWAAPLEEMVAHTLAFDLANRLPEGMVILPGQPQPGTRRSLAVVFEELAPGPDSVFVLDARVVLEGVAQRERITIDLPSMESADIVTAMSQALATLADRIVARL